ncbi:MAG: hypothetical protein MJZ60_02485 [Bacteroidaceae bacterium]|nr:hypothetical protein [Bacteroidaceae bacterium]
METVFDHNMTEEENYLVASGFSKELYTSIFCQDTAYQDIAFLYYHRNDAKKTKKYANKITDATLRAQFWRTILHP